MNYPLIDYPTVLEGYVRGPLRLESLDGSEIYLTEQDEWHLNRFGPRTINGKTYAVTHLQKRSPAGWLKMNPDCYHWWNFWKLQEPGTTGTERGIYFRKGTALLQRHCWRWQPGDKNGNWVWSGGYFGLHWD